MYLMAPLFVLRLFWKSKKLPAYRKRITERFNVLLSHSTEKIDIWIHAVSLGEVIAIIPLVECMLEKKWRILITTMTPTGSERVQKQFSNRVYHQYLPYDLPHLQRRFFKSIKPAVGLIVETELWPNMIFSAYEEKIPICLINARLSERSMHGYGYFKFFFKPLLNRFDCIMAQSKEDAERFIKIGMEATKVEVAGNIKYDLMSNAVALDRYRDVQEKWGNGKVVILAASTHENEEEQLISFFPEIQKQLNNVVLIIAPRHPERFQYVYKLCGRKGFNTGLRSDYQTLSINNEIVILDSLGEMMGWFSISDYAFIGGSLVEHVGGHNVIEPIAFGVPVLTGPFVHNWKSVCQELEKADAIQIKHSAKEIMETILNLYKNPQEREKQVFHACRVMQQNKGAVSHYMKWLGRFLQ